MTSPASDRHHRGGRVVNESIRSAQGLAQRNQRPLHTARGRRYRTSLDDLLRRLSPQRLPVGATSRASGTATGWPPVPRRMPGFRRHQASITRPSSSHALPATWTRPDHVRSSATGSTRNEDPTLGRLWDRRSPGLTLHPPRRASPGTGCSPITVGNPTKGPQEGSPWLAADGRCQTDEPPTTTATTTTSTTGPTSIRRGSSGTLTTSRWCCPR